ncbi:MAG: creatininase family protein [Limisphaerales bacterium]
MRLAEMNWCQVAALSKDTPLVIPVAAMEQHGQHLPLYTDSHLLGEIVRRLDTVLGSRVVVAPLQWLGNSDHHLDFPGTLSAAPRTYLDILESLIENALVHGFRRIVFLNGHGGNDVPGRQAVFEARQRHRGRSDLLLLFATYWNLAVLGADDAREFSQSEMGHACEWETSMILRLNPAWVGRIDALEKVSAKGAFEPASRAWLTRDITTTGHVGDPASATAEKGEILFRTFSEGAVRLLERVLAWDGKSWKG